MLNADLPVPQIATRDIGAYAAERLLRLDFNSKQTHELLGRDLSFNEVAVVIGRAIGKPDLRYAQFPYDQVEQLLLLQTGIPAKTAAYFVEMYRGINEGIVVAVEPRSAENTTPTSIETFVKDVFAPAYRGQAVGA